eukprot:3387075-Amphidinium_carterae.1
MPEGYLLAGEGKAEIDATWTWGTALMAGWFLSVCIHLGVEVSQANLVKPIEQGKETEEDAPPVPMVGGFTGVKWA